VSAIAAALEATAPAQFLKASRWVYPLVNAGHLLGVAVLIGAIVPMDLRLLRGDAGAVWLRRFAAAGLTLAAIFGTLLFVTQAGDYLESGWFRAKMAVLAVALVNVALHPRLAGLPDLRRRFAAGVSLATWPAVLILGRMIGYG
jgi:hypothetical protein